MTSSPNPPYPEDAGGDLNKTRPIEYPYRQAEEIQGAEGDEEFGSTRAHRQQHEPTMYEEDEPDPYGTGYPGGHSQPARPQPAAPAGYHYPAGQYPGAQPQHGQPPGGHAPYGQAPYGHGGPPPGSRKPAGGGGARGFAAFLIFLLALGSAFVLPMLILGWSYATYGGGFGVMTSVNYYPDIIAELPGLVAVGIMCLIVTFLAPSASGAARGFGAALLLMANVVLALQLIYWLNNYSWGGTLQRWGSVGDYWPSVWVADVVIVPVFFLLTLIALAAMSAGARGRRSRR